MGIVVRKNFVRLRDIKLVTREDMFQLGGQIINRITARTNMGIGADGQRFAPYSAAYAKQRATNGLGTSRVDLNVSGEMLNAMTVEEVTDTRVVVGFGKGD